MAESTPANGSDVTLKLAQVLVALRLKRMYGSWRVSGDKVVGPPGMAVFVNKDPCSPDPHGLLLGFSLYREKSEPVLIWDCAHGLGKTPQETLERAVDLWAQSTAATVLELSTQRGEFADHYHGAEHGLPGWHLIHGPVSGFGRGEGPSLLRNWVGQNLLVPQLAGALSAAKLPKDEPTGMKFFLGSSRGEDIAQVQVNHVIHGELSRALAALPWPRFDEPAYARTFVLFVHRE